MLARPLLLLVGFCGCTTEATTSPATSLLRLDATTRMISGQHYALEVGTHCGVGDLGLPADGAFWLTDEAADTAGDWMPPEWKTAIQPAAQLINLDVALSDERALLTATAGGRSVVYRRRTADDAMKPCA